MRGGRPRTCRGPRGASVPRSPAYGRLSDRFYQLLNLSLKESDSFAKSGKLSCLTRPWRSSTAWIALLAGFLISPSQLVGVADRLPVVVENLVAGLAGDPELPGRPRSWPPHREGGPQSAGVLPLPNSLSTASTPPAQKSEKCYPCVRAKCHLCLGPLILAAERFP
jgi:hypothetical protein